MPSAEFLRPRRVLVADDDASIRTVLRKALAMHNIDVHEAENGERALAMLREAPDHFDCIVLDVMMPGLDGYSVLAKVRTDPATADLPVVIVTAHALSDADVIRSIDAGAHDHVMKPFSLAVLIAKIRAACELRRRARVTQSQLRLALEVASVDSLTRLYNRREFEKRLREECAHTKRHARPFALVMIDLDHFKAVNDTYGHEEGDHVLSHTAAIIRGQIREEDFAFRYGGEEFAVLMRACNAKAAVVATARIRIAVAKSPIALGGAEMRAITFSAGIAAADETNAFRIDEMVARADAALYKAKREGRDRTELESDGRAIANRP